MPGVPTEWQDSVLLQDGLLAPRVLQPLAKERNFIFLVPYIEAFEICLSGFGRWARNSATAFQLAGVKYRTHCSQIEEEGINSVHPPTAESPMRHARHRTKRPFLDSKSTLSLVFECNGLPLRELAVSQSLHRCRAGMRGSQRILCAPRFAILSSFMASKELNSAYAVIARTKSFQQSCRLSKARARFPLRHFVENDYSKIHVSPTCACARPAIKALYLTP